MMFGKKKKAAAEQEATEQEQQNQANVEEPAEPAPQEYDGIDFLESELILDDDEVEAEILTDEEAAQLE